VIALERCRATDRSGVYEFLRIAARRELLHAVDLKANSARHSEPDFARMMQLGIDPPARGSSLLERMRSHSGVGTPDLLDSLIVRREPDH
jgi:hypothetical protein